jgi:hypothetical protein
MARDRAERVLSRHYYDENSDDERERRHRHRHRHRDHIDDDYAAAKRERRERRRAEEARREELDLDELRARRESYYSRPDTERRRESQRMAQDLHEKEKPRSSHRGDVRRDGTVRRKKRRERAEDDRSEDYVYGRPKSRAVEEVTVHRSTRHRSDEGGSSSRTAYTPLSGSRSASTRKDEGGRVSRSMSAREPSRYASRPSVRHTSTSKLPTIAATTTSMPITRAQSLSVKEPGRKNAGGLLASFFRPPLRTSNSHKETPRSIYRIVDFGLAC